MSCLAYNWTGPCGSGYPLLANHSEFSYCFSVLKISLFEVKSDCSFYGVQKLSRIMVQVLAHVFYKEMMLIVFRKNVIAK